MSWIEKRLEELTKRQNDFQRLRTRHEHAKTQWGVERKALLAKIAKLEAKPNRLDLASRST